MRGSFTFMVALCCAACGSRVALPPPRLPLTPTPSGATPAMPSLEIVLAAPELPACETFQLANGLKLVVIERHLWAHASIGFITARGGEDGEDLDGSGLASVVSELVVSSGAKPPDDGPAESTPGPTKGAKQSSGSSTSKWLSWSELTLQHAAGLSTEVASGDVDGALAALADQVQRPVIDKKALERARRSVASELSEGRDSLRGVARNHVMQRLYGPNHTLGQHAKMAMERAAKHELDQVIAAYRARFVPASSAIIVVGDVRAEDVRSSIESLFGRWQANSPAPSRYAPPTWQPRGKRKVFLHASSARQAFLALGQTAPAPSSPDYIPFQALVRILAGSGSSRLFAALRAEQGATYHVSASLPTRQDGSTLLIETATERDAAEAAVSRIVREMTRLQQEPVTDAELRRAQLAMLDGIARDWSSDEGAMLSMAQLLSLGREPSALARDVQAVLALTPHTLRDVAVRVLQPKAAPFIVIGNLTGYGQLGQWAANDDEMLP